MSENLSNIELTEIDKVLSEEIKNRDYYFVYIPAEFCEYLNTKKIIYRNQNLKTDALFKLLNTFIFKFINKNQLVFPLYSKILRDNYGKKYYYYIDFLIEKKVISLASNYLAGSHSKIYTFNKEYLKDIKKVKIKDKTILSKINENTFNNIYREDSKSKYSVSLKSRLYRNLYDVSLDEEKAFEYIETLKSDIDVYSKNKITVRSIIDRDFYIYFDDYGRVHTNFTVLKSFIRNNYLKIKGEEVCELDIPNSQPFLLFKYIVSNGIEIEEEEFELFKKITTEGVFYDYISEKANIKNKKYTKDVIFNVLFGENNIKRKYDILFMGLFPSIYKFIYEFKKDDYKRLSYQLQEMESDLIFNKIVRQVIHEIPNISLFTVHDSIIFPKRYKNKVEKIFYKNLYKID